jgi:hypothetical protein
MREPSPRARYAIHASAVFVALLASAAARAESGAPRIAIGLAPHILFALAESCSRDSDVVDCTEWGMFGGGDLGVWVGLLPALSVGARAAVSKDVDGSENASSSTGASWDPRDVLLWRTAAELRLVPLPKARGLWLSLAAGWARLHERSATLGAMNNVISDQVTRDAALVGLGLGYDIWLGDSFKLAPELRGDFIFFSAPPEFRPGVSGRDYGTSFCLEQSLRFAYVF